MNASNTPQFMHEVLQALAAKTYSFLNWWGTPLDLNSISDNVLDGLRRLDAITDDNVVTQTGFSMLSWANVDHRIDVRYARVLVQAAEDGACLREVLASVAIAACGQSLLVSERGSLSPRPSPVLYDRVLRAYWCMVDATIRWDRFLFNRGSEESLCAEHGISQMGFVAANRLHRQLLNAARSRFVLPLKPANDDYYERLSYAFHTGFGEQLMVLYAEP